MMRPSAGLLVCVGVLAAALDGAAAERPGAAGLGFDAAWQQLASTSDELRASALGVASQRELADASASLRLPEVTLELRYLNYQKSLEFPLGPLAPVLGPAGVPDPIELRLDGWRTRPTVTMTLPLYSGGQIPAAQQAAEAALRGAQAESLGTGETLMVVLVRSYFGHQLAERALAVRAEVLAGLELHLARAQAFEREGLISRAQRLQAQVARDEAEREFVQARNTLDTAATQLAALLRLPAPVTTATPLFVLPALPVRQAPSDGSTAASHPRLQRLEALADQSRAAVKYREGQLKPQVFAFGMYDFLREDALFTEPDWIYGVGLRYALVTGTGRREHLRAARLQRDQVEAGMEATRLQLSIATTQAANQADSARAQFMLLDSALQLASENVRLQELSFREGQATSLDVIDARLGLGRARMQRAQAAYDHVVALAQWLEARGEARAFATHAQDPARTIVE